MCKSCVLYIACSLLCMQATILFAGKCVDMNIITANMNINICGHYEYLLGVMVENLIESS